METLSCSGIVGALELFDLSRVMREACFLQAWRGGLSVGVKPKGFTHSDTPLDF